MLIIYFNVCFTSIIDKNNYLSYKEINENFKNSAGKPTNYFCKNIRNNDELFNLLELKGKKNNHESDFSKEEPDKIIKRKNEKTNCDKILIKIIKKKDNFTKVIRKGLYEKYKKNIVFDPKKLPELVEEDLRNLKNSEGYKNFFNDDKLWLIKITNYFDSSVKTIEPTNELREYCKRISEKMQVHFKNLKNKKKIKSVEITLKF